MTKGTLWVSDRHSVSPGRLVKGRRCAPLADVRGQTCQAVRGDGHQVTVLTYAQPVTGDALKLGFEQSIGATQRLRTGVYGKTLTFTLSTTTP